MRKEPDIRKNSLSKIQNPVLVIAGEKDVIKQEHTEFIVKQILHAELRIYKGATHMILYAPGNLNQDILEFLKK
ncbi:alpha/beta fold hydrolase [Chryseobacterium populi]|uniref:Putative hydrolase or acyltransferase of alpha/beta superfamily n=1 Tax=Chryseobacterium populi TaxID=1144316 RepID=J3CIZ6_9FLAO|nr:alpha/beta hydrolase [Chryseobacterium populi]EJL72421.1 putative hydrolase or acyltransferase of alpha/beta superfamily [Chryseobacterium populi]